MTARRLARAIAARRSRSRTHAIAAPPTHRAGSTNRLVTCPAHTPSLTLATARTRVNT